LYFRRCRFFGRAPGDGSELLGRVHFTDPQKIQKMQKCEASSTQDEFFQCGCIPKKYHDTFLKMIGVILFSVVEKVLYVFQKCLSSTVTMRNDQ
jgi:hypothetical protein